MVKHSLGAEASAIASAPRRAIIDRLAVRPASMSELAAELDVSLPAIDKHLRILDEAGMVAKTKVGRTTQISLERGSLTKLGTWAVSTGLMWSNTLDRLAAHLADEPEEPR